MAKAYKPFNDEAEHNVALCVVGEEVENTDAPAEARRRIQRWSKTWPDLDANNDVPGVVDSASEVL